MNSKIHSEVKEKLCRVLQVTEDKESKVVVLEIYENLILNYFFFFQLNEGCPNILLMSLF